jgi:N-acetylmuramoyl-L-alanine amidase
MRVESILRAVGGAARAAALVLALHSPGAARAADAFSLVLDPGHGGADFGGEGASGLLEKDLVLALAKRVGEELKRQNVSVIFTRERDEFVSLAQRTEIANKSGAQLFLSIHANTAPNHEAHGLETYFLSLEASDEEARRVAQAENDVFHQAGAVPDGADVVGGILSDLIRTRHLAESSEAAAAIQRRAARVAGTGRGVKQAPFVVLMGVNMPSVLLEAGFLTHAAEEQRLRSADHQRALARAIAAAVREFADARASAAAREMP